MTVVDWKEGAESMIDHEIVTLIAHERVDMTMLVQIVVVLHRWMRFEETGREIEEREIEREEMWCGEIEIETETELIEVTELIEEGTRNEIEIEETEIEIEIETETEVTELIEEGTRNEIEIEETEIEIEIEMWFAEETEIEREETGRRKEVLLVLIVIVVD